MSKCANRGMSKHRTKGHSVNNNHFTGIKKKKGTSRKQALTALQKRLKRGTHVNKYVRVA
ncbi:hypothetical protein LCGC14_0664110 [marine sediment metagenome]|uniref:Uncharacterized protein n=1 Tax=marine sediment metagenome TaxID=412755 RepID=A0A0F9TE57_9ZZZZ